jgi:hypothetical protein
MGGPEKGRCVGGVDDDERLRRRLVMRPASWSVLDRSSMMKPGGHVYDEASRIKSSITMSIGLLLSTLSMFSMPFWNLTFFLNS